MSDASTIRRAAAAMRFDAAEDHDLFLDAISVWLEEVADNEPSWEYGRATQEAELATLIAKRYLEQQT